jgi:protein SCO1
MSTRSRKIGRRLAAALALFIIGAGAPATRCAAQAGSSATAQGTAAQNYFTDVELVNQDGKPMRLYSDLMKDRVVIINAFFTTCTSICPPMTANLSKVQNWLGDRLGKEVHMLSISVDPLTDTPPRLKDYAQKFGARPGWYFLSGKKENVDFALRKLGQFVEEKNDHTSIVIIGNLRTGLWKKAFGLAKPDELIKVVESVVNDKPAESK